MEGLRPRETDPRWQGYEEAVAGFRWQVPARFNIAAAVCDRHAATHPQQTALLALNAAGAEQRTTFRQLKDLSDRLALAMAAQGVRRGDRVAVMLPQRVETALAHLAAYKLGAIVVPLTTLFRHDALAYRLADSEAVLMLLDAAQLPLLEGALDELPALRQVVAVRSPEADPVPPDTWHGRALLDFWPLLQDATGTLHPVNTGPDDPALLIYTSGTTGNPKGTLHAHRVLLGHLPGFELSHEFAPREGDCFYSPAEWAWIGGLLDVLLPAWHHGLPVVAYDGQGPFDPEACLSLLARHGVRNAFIPPTALRMMAQVPQVRERFALNLRTLMSGGEALGEATLTWAREQLGVNVNEIFGQTEVNYVVGNCAPLWPITPGSMGRPYPGHQVAVLDEAGDPQPPGTTGEVAVNRHWRDQTDPVFFLEYWRQPEATAAKFSGDWARTGDLAARDENGYLWFKGRADDVIISAGHRIGPTEIEGVLNRHPAVALSAVIAAPDTMRGSIVKAFVKLAPGYAPEEALKQTLQRHVQDHLARHEYPRAIEFRDEFPLTTTGKIRRVALRELEQTRAERQGG